MSKDSRGRPSGSGAVGERGARRVCSGGGWNGAEAHVPGSERSKGADPGPRERGVDTAVPFC